MKILFDHISDDALRELHRESIRLRDEAFDEDAPKWVLYSRIIRHDEIVQALADRGLLSRSRPPARATKKKERA